MQWSGTCRIKNRRHGSDYFRHIECRTLCTLFSKLEKKLINDNNVLTVTLLVRATTTSCCFFLLQKWGVQKNKPYDPHGPQTWVQTCFLGVATLDWYLFNSLDVTIYQRNAQVSRNNQSKNRWISRTDNSRTVINLFMPFVLKKLIYLHIISEESFHCLFQRSIPI